MKSKVVIKICDLDYLEVVVKPSKIYGGRASADTRASSEEATFGNKIPSGIWSF
jgi:hypothetical protein